MEEIRFYIKDEEDANKTYSRMASDADDAGMHDTARILRGMAADELRHKEMLEGMYYRPEFGPARERRSIVESRVFQEAAGLWPTIYYWEATNMVVGEIAQSSTKWSSIQTAVVDAIHILDEEFRDWGSDHIVIKVFTQSPDERVGITFTPVHTESYWRGTGTRVSRPFPQAYSDWVNLAEDIKQKDSNPETWDRVNDSLGIIAGSIPGNVDDAKRWLVTKAGKLGIR